MKYKMKALLRSRRFIGAISGIIIALVGEELGLIPSTIENAVTLIMAWIIGDSMRETILPSLSGPDRVSVSTDRDRDKTNTAARAATSDQTD